MTKGVVSGGGLISSPSQTLRRRLVWTTDDGRCGECSARRLPPFVAALFLTLRDSYGWHHCRPVCSEARYSSRIAFLPTPPAFDAPVRGSPSDCLHPVWHGKTRMAWLPVGEKNLKISLFVFTQLTNVTGTHTDTQTDTAWRHRPRLCISSRGKKWITAGLKASSKRKFFLYKKWIETRSAKNEANYKTYRILYKKIASEAEESYFNKL